MKLTAGIEYLDLPKRFGNATRRILLHAAVYGPFAESRPHRNNLAKALNKSSFERLDIIALTSKAPQPWQEQFLEVLRSGASPDTKVSTVAASDDFLAKIQIACPSKVFTHPLTTWPCHPLIIVDDTIIFGQYAHSSAYAAQGFWGHVETDVAKLFCWAEAGTIPAEATSEEIAAYRLICECHHAMQPQGAKCKV